jgi:hypothetical protein
MTEPAVTSACDQRPLIVLVDDVRHFADDRPCRTFRTSAAAVAGLTDVAKRGPEISEMGLDYDLGRDDDLRPVLDLLDSLDGSGRRLQVHTTYT